MDTRGQVTFDADDGGGNANQGSSSIGIGDHDEEDAFDVGPLNMQQLIANDEEQGRVRVSTGGIAANSSSRSNDDSIIIGAGGDFAFGGRTTSTSRTSTQSTISTMMSRSSANCSNNFDISASSLSPGNFAASPSRRLRRTSLFVDHSSSRSLRNSHAQRHSSGGSSRQGNSSSYQSAAGEGNSSTTSQQNEDCSMPFHRRKEESFDDDLLRSVLQNCGQWATGVVYVQLWVMNEQRNRLVRPDAGWWLDPMYHDCSCCSNRKLSRANNMNSEDEEKVSESQDENSSSNSNNNTGIFGRKRKSNQMCHLCRLEDKNHPHYVPTEPLPIGMCEYLPGEDDETLKPRTNEI